MIILLCLVSLVFAKPEPLDVPSFELAGTNSKSGAPLVNIIFPNGHQDALDLFHHYSHSDDQLSSNCAFFGSMKYDKDACIAMTGCPGIDDLELTVNTGNAKTSGMFLWKKDGTVEPLLDEKDSRMLRKDDEEIYPPGLPLGPDGNGTSSGRQDFCWTGGSCEPVPPTHRLKIKVGIDALFLWSKGNQNKSPEKFVAQMFTHLQSWFCHPSLGTKVQLERTGAITLFDQQWRRANSDILSTVRDLAEANPGDSDLYVFLTAGNSAEGLAYMNVVCSANVGSRVSITSVSSSVGTSSKILAHELGHNWGMSHDFDDKHDQKGCEDSLMDHISGSLTTPWSECSKQDLVEHYNAFLTLPQFFVSMEWCLPEEPNACTEAAQPSPPENPVSDRIVVGPGNPWTNTRITETVDAFNNGYDQLADFSGQFPAFLLYSAGDNVEYFFAAYNLNFKTSMICGGYDASKGLTTDCYLLWNNAWVKRSGMLSTPRWAHAAINIGNGNLLVTGGSDASFNLFDSTEIVSLANVVMGQAASTSGPSLPEGRAAHCMAKVSDNQILLVGGGNKDQKYASSLIYDIDGNSWSNANADMSIERNAIACGTLIDEDDGTLYVIVAGGVDLNDNKLTLTEIYNTATGEFSLGPDLPRGLYASTMVSSADNSNLVLLGGMDANGNFRNEIYQIRCANGDCNWTELDETLLVGRAMFPAFLKN